MSHSPDHSPTSSFFAISDHPPSPPSPTVQIPASDEAAIGALIDAEIHHMPERDYLERCRDRFVDTTARSDAIDWILKVHAFYHFRPVTAFLSVNYLDRFLSLTSLPRPNGWPFQLLSVACLSLAAKMEETDVPLLLDLQLFEPRFVFEPKTVQRMELRVMTILQWRLRSVTPFDYLNYFLAKLPSSESMTRFFSIASDLILSTTRVIDFLRFTPSTVAAAAVLCSAGYVHDIVSDDTQLPLCFHGRVNKEMVRCCHQLMEEYVVDACPATREKTRRADLAPPSSPIGVLDAAACASCDYTASSADAQQAEPPNKRLRADYTANA